jgi:NAD(P)-dependent dehydrogenase (short-subunit alcohol dehydrogenase family)
MASGSPGVVCLHLSDAGWKLDRWRISHEVSRPVKRLGPPDQGPGVLADLMGAILFLASDAAAMVTGASLVVSVTIAFTRMP